MPPLLDITGKTFGRLTVLQIGDRRPRKGGTRRIYWLCECSCKKTVLVEGFKLRSGHTKSCGCIQFQHGMTRTDEYQCWSNMLKRCYNSSHVHYKDYGGRGITVCKRWRDDFTNFYKDMGLRPYGLTIERINNDKGYYPTNCKWVTPKEQAANKRLPQRYVNAMTEVA